MDYLQCMNDALSYIESNLDGDIDYKMIENCPAVLLCAFKGCLLI